MAQSIPYLLYANAFLDGEFNEKFLFEDEWERVTQSNGNANLLEEYYKLGLSEYEGLLEAAKSLKEDLGKYRDENLQKIVFNADYRFPYKYAIYPLDKILASDQDYRNLDIAVTNYRNMMLPSLIAELAEQHKIVDNIISGLGGNLYRYLASRKSPAFKDGNIVIQNLASESKNYEWDKDDNPMVYISSPFSAAKSKANLQISSSNRPSNIRIPSIDDSTDSSSRDLILEPGEKKDGFTSLGFYPYTSTLADDESFGKRSQLELEIKGGDSDDIIIYDQSQRKITLSAGNDVALPAAAAFQPIIHFGENINSHWDELAYGATLKKGFGEKNTIAPSEEITRSFNGVQWNQDGKYQLSIEANSGPIFNEKKSIDGYVINVGGQEVYGGEGNDLLFGLDPSLYAGMKAQEQRSFLVEQGELDLYFLNVDNEKVFNTRIQWDPILLSGGTGSDVFQIGDLNNIKIENSGSSVLSGSGRGLANTVYTVIGDHSDTNSVNQNAKNKASWGENISPDITLLTASYDYTPIQIRNAINIESDTVDEEDSTSTADKIKNVLDILSNVGEKVDKLIPGFNTAISVAGTVVNVGQKIMEKVDQFKHRNDATADFSQDELIKNVVPPGPWTKAINMPDWDPLDQISIQVIPNLKADDDKNPYDNIEFSVRERGVSSSGVEPGYELLMQTSKDQSPKPFVYLSGIDRPSLNWAKGFKTWDFINEREVIIDPSTHMSFLGVLSNFEEAQKLKTTYTEEKYNDLVIEEDSSFSSIFVWNSTGIDKAEPSLEQGASKDSLLNQYRAAASSIICTIDSRQFGWFSDIHASDQTDDIDVLNKSTFNYYSKKDKAWKKATFADIQAGNDKEAAKAALKAKYSYHSELDKKPLFPVFNPKTTNALETLTSPNPFLSPSPSDSLDNGWGNTDGLGSTEPFASALAPSLL